MALEFFSECALWGTSEKWETIQAARLPSKLSWTKKEWDRLIFAHGFELIEGRLIPKVD